MFKKVVNVLGKRTFSTGFSSSENVRKKILKNTSFCRRHLAPEIGLQLLTPKSEIWSKKFEEEEKVNAQETDEIDKEEFGFFPDPYWAFFWPGGQGVTRYLLDNPSLVDDKSVLDLGCGCGAGSIAAKISRAKKVLANDIDNNALEAASLNWEINFKDKKFFGQLETSQENFLENASSWNKIGNEFEVLLVGDLFFDKKIGNLTLKMISQFLVGNSEQSNSEDLKGKNEVVNKKSSGKTVLVGDPGRWFLNDPSFLSDLKFRCVAKYEMPENLKLENNGLNHSFVYEVTK